MTAYRIVPWIYWLIPIAAAAWMVWACRKTGSVKPFRLFLTLCISGVALGIGGIVMYEMVTGGHVSGWQTILTCYWMTAIFAGISAINWAAERGLRRLLRLNKVTLKEDGTPRPHSLGWFVAATGASVVRAAIIFCLGAAILLVNLLTFRPKITHPGDPTTILNAAYVPVRFDSTDGVRLSGWWIPAQRSARTDRHGARPFGADTIILCHGIGADKAAQLGLVRDLVPNGYNVLAIDFRAHGESGGQITTFGHLERFDVLGAVRWIKANHPDESRRILGLGINTGAAALLGAAADQSADGQSIDAIATIQPFDSVTDLITDLAESNFAPGPGWVATRIGLPLAAEQMGTSLRDWSSADDVQHLWPRPLLVIQPNQDRMFLAARARELFDAAQQPKYGYWIDKETMKQILFSDKKASFAIRVFFGGARSIL